MIHHYTIKDLHTEKNVDINKCKRIHWDQYVSNYNHRTPINFTRTLIYQCTPKESDILPGNWMETNSNAKVK